MSLSSTLSNTWPSVKSLAKLALQSRPVRVPQAEHPAIVILANGPSLNDTMARHADMLKSSVTMAVNFAANTDMFFELRPRYYVMVDPVFFGDDSVANIARLRQRLAEVSWPMTIFVPRRFIKAVPASIKANPNISTAGLNTVGIEGWQWLKNFAYSSRLGMPRPRNVLIPAIMAAIAMGYKEIYLTGADHSWMKTLSVDDNNNVVSVQPHFYKDNEAELHRVDTTYRGLRLHDVVESFAIAFRSYHTLACFAARQGISIYNSTPGSFIDAFERRPLPSQP